MKKFTKKPGYIALVAILVLAGAMLAIAMSVGLGGITEAQSGLFINTSSESLQLADSCAEEAYFRLKLDSTYNGGTLALGSETCDINITGGGSSRRIDTSARVDLLTQEIEADIDLVSNSNGDADSIQITTWE